MPQSSDYLDAHWQPGEAITYSFNVSALGAAEFSASYQSLFETAMSQWSAVAEITFEEISDPYTADWIIGWDPYTDGPGGVLGWALNVDFDEDGILGSSQFEFSQIALDPYDTWSFYATAIHEAGHALGIAHIDHTESIMATYENGLESLTAYDIEVIQSIYGARDSFTTEYTGTDAADTIIGSIAGDTMSGLDGQDTLSGGTGGDLIYGNKGGDLLVGGSGADTLFGGQNDGDPSGTPLAQRDGWDTISGGDGNDLIYGNHGNDFIDGGDGWDTIYGGQDDDSIFGGQGQDDLYGNAGADTFVFTDADEGFDYIVDFDISEDRLQLTGSVSVTATTGLSDATYIGLTSGTTIKLVGISVSDISAFTDYIA